MKIVKQKADDLVLFVGGDLVLTDTGLTGNNWRADFATTANCDIFDVDNVPAAFCPSGFTCVIDSNGVASWTANADGLANTKRLSNRNILAQISAIEATVTDRRLREAVLGIDGDWLAATNTTITNLRAQLQA